MKQITRREFLIGSALLTATAMMADGRWLATAAGDGRKIAERLPAFSGGLLSRSRGRPAAIVAARGADYSGKLRQAVRKLGGKRLLARPGDRVVIKPTLAWNRAPGQGANVHPQVLGATIEMALRGGAQQVTIFDRTSLRSDFAYRISGADQVVRELNDPRVILVHLTPEDFVPLRMAQSPAIPSDDSFRPFEPPRASDLSASIDHYKVCRYLLDADRVINLATARHHPTRRVSLGMANLLGLIGGGPADATWLRHRDAELAILSAAVRPELTILDATRAIIRNGPMGRGTPDVARWDTLVVSRDPLAVEAYGAQLFGLDVHTLPHLQLAERLGLGVSDVGHGRLIEI